MSKKFKIILFSIATIGLVVFLVFNYVMHGGERNLTTEKTDFSVSAQNIIAEFEANIEASNEKYLEKAVAIKGTITDIKANEVILNHSIICDLKNFDASIKKNQIVTIKGRIVGYDDLMGDLKMDKCFVIIN